MFICKKILSELVLIREYLSVLATVVVKDRVGNSRTIRKDIS